ncbi:Na/Pi cotransporter family protein [Thiomicrorhabdus sp. 6S3-12]|uniref:Na/Pi cotransporter family protein n=1 Tax=Thiomicrorhabdus sp. 6S3-12 TaxID=2819681 RepID=UPI001FB6A21E|nr:Na/Pi cotransporter family protein [Thiomicrorhabdus sp. 6S3-12]
MSFLIVFVFLAVSFSAFSANDMVAVELQNGVELDWFQMTMGLAGGLALFLYGMDLMVRSLMMVAGDQMKGLLAKLTTNRVMGALTGAGITAVIQSSSITTVLTVGFVSAGLMTLTQAAGVIMGANLGTTVTAQIVAFKVTNFALLMIAVGFLMNFAGKLHKTRALGQLILGLGLIFFGMNLMSQGMAPLRSYQPFLDLMLEMQNPFLAILVGALFTALIQSSSATIGIIIVMASNGFLTLPAGIALAMGAHIGTTITALLASIGKSRDALRTALVHTLFNVLVTLIWLPLIPDLAQWAIWMSSHDPGVNGSMAVLAQNVPREIANANTLMVAIALIVLLPFVPIFVWAVNRLVPKIEEEKVSMDLKPDHLDESFISTPSVAIQAVTLEIQSYQKQQSLFYKRMVALISDPDINKLSKEMVNLQKFKSYQQQILSYLARTAQGPLSDSEHGTYTELMLIVHGFESMRTAMEDHIVKVIDRMISEDIKPSDTMLNLVGQLTNEVAKSIDKSLNSLLENDPDSAIEVMGAESKIEHLIQEALDHQLKRFQRTEKRLSIFRFEMEIIEGFKQLYSLSKRLARAELGKANAATKAAHGEQKS